MRAGDLRHRVALLSVTNTKTSGGKITQSETELATVWGDVAPLQGRELFVAQQVQSDITTRIKIRYFEGITTQHRVRHGQTTYDIRQIVNPQMRNVLLELMCLARRV